jgi:hypothetical protein
MEIRYLPQMLNETEFCYQFVTIDRTMRWVFMEIDSDHSDSNSDFLIKLKTHA